MACTFGLVRIVLEVTDGMESKYPTIVFLSIHAGIPRITVILRVHAYYLKYTR